MNTKFNLGSIEVKVPQTEDTPEINISIKDMSYEVTDMSLTEYGSVFKSIFTEGVQAVKEFSALQEKQRQTQFEREQAVHEMRMAEITAQAKRDAERRTSLTFGQEVEQELEKKPSSLGVAPVSI